MNFNEIYIAHFLSTSVRKKRYIYLSPDCTCNYVIFINVPVVCFYYYLKVACGVFL